MKTPKTPFLLTVAGWMLFSVCHAYAAPFAPLVDLPDDISSSKISFLEAQTVQKSVIPSKEDVGVPAYPDAKILFTQTGNKANVNGRQTALPDQVFLGTTAPFNTVVEFYKEHLKAWNFNEEDGSVIFFEENATTVPAEDPTLQKILLSPDDDTRNLMPEAQTTIHIHYYPQQQEQPE